jgi:hypothetical protein
MNPSANFDLARRLRGKGGAPIGEVFSFLSGLYFRGKLAYAKRFGHASRGLECCYVITTSEGLVATHRPVTLSTLEGYAKVPIDLADERYFHPLLATANGLGKQLAPNAEVVLLGRIATGKYVEPLRQIFGKRLLFPVDFIGRGDMSRGGLLLRAVASNKELAYQPIIEAARLSGPRPPKLVPLPPRACVAKEPDQ